MSENIVAPARKEVRHLVGADDKICPMASQAILAQVLYCRWIRTEAGEWV
jgi:hypothetical protein